MCTLMCTISKMADYIARALQRRLHNKSYPYMKQLKLCQQVFFSKRFSNVQFKNKVVLEWLVYICSENPCENNEKKILNALKVLLTLLKLAVTKDLASTCVENILPDNLASVLLTWLNYLPVCKDEELPQVVYNVWKYLLENGLLDRYFQQNTEEYVGFFSIVMSTIAKFSVNENAKLKEDLFWIFNWILNMTSQIKGQTLSNIQLFRLYEEQFKPHFLLFLNSNLRVTLDIELQNKVKDAVGVLFFPKDIDQKAKEVITCVFSPECKPGSFFDPFLSIMEKLIVDSMVVDGFITTSYIFNYFLEKFRNFDIELKLNFFSILIRILGIDLYDQNTKPIGFQQNNSYFNTEFNDCEESMRSLLCILDVASRHLSIGVENKTKESPLFWFHNLSSFLLNYVASRGKCWLQCLKKLLNLNCQLIFANIKLVLKKTWINSDFTETEIIAEQNNFLCEILETYAKLHQIPVFIRHLLQLSHTNSLTKALPMMFKKKFGKSIIGMSCGPSLDLWRQLISALQTSNDDNVMLAAIELLSYFLMNFRVMDVKLPLAQWSQLTELSYQTAHDVLRKLLILCVSKKEVPLLESSLFLALNWGELHLALTFYNPRYNEEWTKFEIPYSPFTFKKFSNLHFYISCDANKAIWKFGEKKSTSILFLCRILALQTMRNVVLLGDKNAEINLAVLKSGANYLPHCTDFESEVPELNDDMINLKRDNISIATWDLLSFSTSSVEPNLLHTYANAFVNAIMATLDWNNIESCYQKVLTFSSKLNEDKLMQFALVTNIIQSYSSMLNDLQENQSIKKIIKCFCKLSEKPEMWMKNGDAHPAQSQENIMWKTIQKSARYFNKFLITALTQNNICVDDSCVAMFYQRFKLLNSLPLEYFLPCNQVRCLISTFGVLAFLIHQSYHTNKTVEIVHLGITNLNCILDGFRSIWMFNFVEVVTLFNWLFHSLSKFILEIGKRVLVTNEAYTELKQDTKMLLQKLTILAKKDNDVLQSLESFISQNQLFSLDESLIFEFSVTFLKILTVKLQKKGSKPLNKFLTLCSSYQKKLSSDLLDSLSTYFNSRVRDVTQLPIMLEGISYLIQNSEARSELSIQMSTHLSVPVYNLVVDTTKSYNDINCLRSCCQILPFFIQNEDFKLKISKDIFEDAWRAIERLIVHEKSTTSDNEMASHMINSCSLQQFTLIINRSLEQMKLFGSEAQLIEAIRMLKLIVSSSLDERKNEIVYNISIQIFTYICIIVDELSLSSHDVITEIFEVQTAVFHYTKVSPECISLCLRSCQTSKFDSIQNDLIYSKYANSIFNILNEVLESQKAPLVGLLSPFLRIVHQLLQSIIQRSEQDTILHAGYPQLRSMSNLAQKMQRLFVRISSLKSDFSSVAPHIVSDFVMLSSKFTIHAAIKNLLIEGIYSVMDLLDMHSNSLLVALLNPTGREVFNVMYENYKKYYSYTGRV